MVNNVSVGLLDSNFLSEYKYIWIHGPHASFRTSPWCAFWYTTQSSLRILYCLTCHVLRDSGIGLILDAAVTDLVHLYPIYRKVKTMHVLLMCDGLIPSHTYLTVILVQHRWPVIVG